SCAEEFACQRGNVDVAQQLLSHRANVNVKDKQSKTPLHLAAEKGDHTMVELLLSFNADPNAMDKEKKTPLHIAAIGGHLNTAKVLLAQKARFGIKDMDGLAEFSATDNQAHIVTLLKKKMFIR
uniref:Uncharacterized protein n=1 Tax=Pelusios castaneus TaxID=367368 RepID=A0A8C8SWU2_9SAUR